MNIGSNSSPGIGPGQAESGGSSTESSSFTGGLMFGQKIYFEDAGGGTGSSSSGGSNRRVVRGSGSGPPPQIPRCQVEGCGMDLTNAKGYYTRHRVCGIHSKTPKVIVAGLEQRFCQQCSRFHQLPEFDLEKRSCRRRLAGHNERRRKPQPASLSVLSSRYGRITPSLYGNAETTMNGSFLGSQDMGWNSARTLDTRVMRRPPSWQINPMNVFSQGSVSGGGGGGISFSSPEIMDTKPESSYKGIGSDSNCALSLLSNPHQTHDNNNNNNNTWRTSSGFGPMTVTMAQPPPAAPSQHQYLNPPWMFKDDDNNCANDMSPVLNLGRFTETEISGGTTLGEFELSDHHHQHHQNRRQYMESENTRAYDSSSHHNNWSL